MKREHLSDIISNIDEGLVAQAARYAPDLRSGSPERIVHMKKKRIVSIALAAALILALGVTVCAVAGIVRSTGKNPMPKTADYDSLADIPKIEKDVGYPVTAPEEFSNGYRFDGLRVEGEAVFGEGGDVLKEFYGVRVTYVKPGKPDVCLELSPVQDQPGGAQAPAPNEVRTIGGVRVSLSLDRYKLVPEGYEKTAEDTAREAAGHFFITYGPETVSECDYAFAAFAYDGVSYVLMDMEASPDSLDALAQMAGELIEAAGG